MKLGFWNRLAIAVSGLAMIVAPLWAVNDANINIQKSKTQYDDLCRKLASAYQERGDMAGYAREIARCDEYREKVTYVGWELWWQATAITLACCAVLYALIWLSAATIKWVWRGREVSRQRPSAQIEG